MVDQSLKFMNQWDEFSQAKLKKIFTDKKSIVDIGGGLRIDPKRNNRFNSKNLWLNDYLSRVDYKVLDKVADFNPDIVGDIHHLPLADNSIDAVICVAVLEHVENPHLAASEIFRVLKPGGYFYGYVPFLYYYHPMSGYYKDFYRFTKDGVAYLFKDFKTLELANVRGAFETINNLYPKKVSKFTVSLSKLLDKLFKKENSNQTSGYNIFCTK